MKAAEVIVPPPPSMDFNFDMSACSSPYMTAPSSPQSFGNNFLFSAPTSPSRAAALFHELHSLANFDDIYNNLPCAENSMTNAPAASIPFEWEETPGIRKVVGGSINGEEDFEFSVSGQTLERNSLTSAEELFYGGKIKPVKPPPCLQVINNDLVPRASTCSSPRSPRSPVSNSLGKRIMSPRKNRNDFDPFEAAILKEQKRGRESSVPNTSSSFVRKGTRSLSPTLRVSDIVPDPDINPTSPGQVPSATSNLSTKPNSFSSILSTISFSKGYRKWSFKDFLLFRSASEGRGTDKDPLKKYSMLSRKDSVMVSQESEYQIKISSFRSTDSSGSVSSSRRPRVPVSAHELHYTVNRAVSKEMRKKTFLPYKQGLLGCLGFTQGMHEISRSFGSTTHG